MSTGCRLSLWVYDLLDGSLVTKTVHERITNEDQSTSHFRKSVFNLGAGKVYIIHRLEFDMFNRWCKY